MDLSGSPGKLGYDEHGRGVLDPVIESVDNLGADDELDVLWQVTVFLQQPFPQSAAVGACQALEHIAKGNFAGQVQGDGAARHLVDKAEELDVDVCEWRGQGDGPQSVSDTAICESRDWDGI